MSDPARPDAVIIGAGPNGLAAAALLARKGWDVTVLEAASRPGGAIRTEALTVPGYRHDTFSAFYGLLHASPAFGMLGLDDRVDWARFPIPVAAAVDPRTAAGVHGDPEETAEGLASFDPTDGDAWRDLWAWWRGTGSRFFDATLAPLPAIRPGLRFARRVGIRGALPTAGMLLAPAGEIAAERFRSDAARALFVSGTSHTDLGIDHVGSTPMTLILAMIAQEHGMPIPVGGAGTLADALADVVTDAGGTIRCDTAVTRVLHDGRRAHGVTCEDGTVVLARHAVLADTGAPALFRDLVGEEHLPARFLDGLRRFRYGTGMFKMDLALRGPVPWSAPLLRQSGVVHLTGAPAAMMRAASEARRGALPARPMLIVGQQTLADPSRAPEGCHTLWIETHVPPAPTTDGADGAAVDGWVGARERFAERVLDLIEEHAPGTRDLIVGTAVHAPPELEAKNRNLVGGDAGGGSAALDQQLVFRPVPGWFRYRTPIRGLYLCSASAHPGGGVHGMAGINAARRALRDARRPAGILRTAGGGRRAPARAR